MDDRPQQPDHQPTGDSGGVEGHTSQPPPSPYQPAPYADPYAPQYGQQGYGEATQDYTPPPPQGSPPGNYQPPPQGYSPPLGYSPQQGYYGQPSPPPPPTPPNKRGLPVWAWLLPLLLLVIGIGGASAWAVLSAQDKTASQQRPAGTSTAQAVASSTARVGVAATRGVRGTQTADADITALAELELGFYSTITAISEQSFETATPEAATLEPERIPLDEFKRLYDDPATRPLIVDVRNLRAYEQSHIAGSINLSIFDLEGRMSELPKDKLIVAYCQ